MNKLKRSTGKALVKSGREKESKAEFLTTKEIIPAHLSKEEKKRMKMILRRIRKTKSSFKEHVPKLYHMIESGDQAKTADALQRAFILMLTELIPIAENTFRKFGNERAAYALNAMISQVRELVADQKAEQDLGALATKLCDDVLLSAFRQLGENMATSFYHLRETAMPLVPKNERAAFRNRLEESAVDMSKYATELFKQTRERVVSLMVS